MRQCYFIILLISIRHWICFLNIEHRLEVQAFSRFLIKGAFKSFHIFYNAKPSHRLLYTWFMPIKNCKISTTGNFCFHLIPVDDKQKFSLLTRDYGTQSCCSEALNMYFRRNYLRPLYVSPKIIFIPCYQHKLSIRKFENDIIKT